MYSPTATRSHGNFSNNGALPSAVTARTISFCYDNDIVCAPGLGSSCGNHTSYSQAELNAMGIWAARRFLGLN